MEKLIYLINVGDYNLMTTSFGVVPKEAGNYLIIFGVVRDEVVMPSPFGMQLLTKIYNL